MYPLGLMLSMDDYWLYRLASDKKQDKGPEAVKPEKMASKASFDNLMIDEPSALNRFSIQA